LQTMRGETIRGESLGSKCVFKDRKRGGEKEKDRRHATETQRLRNFEPWKCRKETEDRRRNKGGSEPKKRGGRGVDSERFKWRHSSLEGEAQLNW